MRLLFYRGWCRRNRRLFGIMLLDMTLWCLAFVGVISVQIEVPISLQLFLCAAMALLCAGIDSLIYSRK